jgi:hypothetical protein
MTLVYGQVDYDVEVRPASAYPKDVGVWKPIQPSVWPPGVMQGERHWLPHWNTITARSTVHPYTIYTFSLPLWILTIMFALTCGLSITPLVRMRRSGCAKCHYDLRGLPKDAAACPECGARITGKKA